MRAAILVAVLVLGGCGGAESEPSEPVPSAGQPIPGGGLAVRDAIDSELDGLLMVRGYLIERDGELRLCEAILESSPPQCGEPSLRVEGAAQAASEEYVSLLGEVDDEKIVVSTTEQG